MNILDYETVALIDDDDAIEIIDQTLLPGRTEIIRLHTGKEIWDAIYLLQVRGAPAIGVSAGMGLYLLMKHTNAQNYEEFMAELQEKSDYLNSSRPTAVNLSWALKRMKAHVEAVYSAITARGKETSPSETQVSSEVWSEIRVKLLREMHDECERIKAEDIDVCRRIGEYGLTLIEDGYGLLTHCNAGQLCACKYGTATAPMYLAHEKGYKIKVYCDETRPLLQGARLTAYELHSAGIDTTLLCDNMSASLMKSGAINAVFTGCDRVAANGDAANKIGTSMVALAARRYGGLARRAWPRTAIGGVCRLYETQAQHHQPPPGIRYRRPLRLLTCRLCSRPREALAQQDDLLAPDDSSYLRRTALPCHEHPARQSVSPRVTSQPI